MLIQNLGGQTKSIMDSHPGQSFSLSLSGVIATSWANAHMVYMGSKIALHITLS